MMPTYRHLRLLDRRERYPWVSASAGEIIEKLNGMAEVRVPIHPAFAPSHVNRWLRIKKRTARSLLLAREAEGQCFAYQVKTGDIICIHPTRGEAHGDDERNL